MRSSVLSVYNKTDILSCELPDILLIVRIFSVLPAFRIRFFGFRDVFYMVRFHIVVLIQILFYASRHAGYISFLYSGEDRHKI